MKLSQVFIGVGKTSVSMTIEIQGGARPGSYTLTSSGQAQVLFTKDPTKPKANTLVTLPSQPVTLVFKAKKP
jgi:hypothetical protein